MDRIRCTLNIVLGATLAVATGGAIAQSVTTLAGSGTVGGADGNAAEASFSRPSGLAVDSSGSVYVADTGNHKIRKIAPNGTVSTLAGSGSTGFADGDGTAASFRFPKDVAVDASRNVYVIEWSYWACCGAGSDADIRKIAPDGSVTTVANLGRYVMSVSAVTLDGAGNLFVADEADYGDGITGKILKVTRAGSITTLTGSGTPFQVKGPSALEVDALGNLYVADYEDRTLTRLAPDGSTTILATGLAYSNGLAVDRAGIIYVAETAKNRILRIAPDGAVSTVAGSGLAGDADGPGAAATFHGPAGLALDGAGNLYVADAGNNKVRRIRLTSGFTDWTVPSVARTSGPNGSFWTSDLTVHNRGSTPATLTLKFLGHDVDGTEGPETSATIGPYQTVTFADVLASVFGIGNGWGAVRVRDGSGQIAVRSRTSTLRAGGTVGDGVPGVRTDRFFTDETAPSPVLTGLHENDRFRSNLVLVNGSAAPVDVLVTAFDSGGAALGSRTYTLRAFEATQDSRFLARAEFGAAAKTDVTVSVWTATPGGSFTAYAALIDNGSNAPTTVLPQ